MLEPQLFSNGNDSSSSHSKRAHRDHSKRNHNHVKLLDTRRGGNKTSSVEGLRYGYRLASRDFLKEGGVFKAINNAKEDKDHYTQIHPRDSPSFLTEYAPKETQAKAILAFANDRENEGVLIKGVTERSVFVLENGKRRQVGGMDIFLARNWSLDQIIHASDFVIETIPKGEPLVPIKV